MITSTDFVGCHATRTSKVAATTESEELVIVSVSFGGVATVLVLGVSALPVLGVSSAATVVKTDGSLTFHSEGYPDMK